jgi:4-carboxymuconolactone decarboxylase
MSVLQMDPARLSPAARALFDEISARRKAHGEGFGGPYLALLNHPELARRIEQLGFFLKFEGVLPRPVYQFIVLSVAHSTGATFEWQDHIQHALAAGLPREVIDAIGSGAPKALPHPYALLHEILARTMTWQPVPDDLQSRAAAEWGPEGLVEVVVVSGFYQMFATINQGFAIGAGPARGQSDGPRRT